MKLQIRKMGGGDQLPQPGSAGPVELDEIQLVIGLRDRSRVVQRETEQDLQDGLVENDVIDWDCTHA